MRRFWIFDFRLRGRFWIGDRLLRITNKSVPILLIVIIASWLTAAVSLADGENLPKIKPAPEFTLTKQDGVRLALKELRGKVLAITFIFASCADTCPLLTAKMADIQDRLGADFGKKIYFVSITVDPERASPSAMGSFTRKRRVATSIIRFSRRSWITTEHSAFNTWESSLIRTRCYATFRAS